jgi:hypothetical protein
MKGKPSCRASSYYHGMKDLQELDSCRGGMEACQEGGGAKAISLPDARQLSDEVLETLRLRALRGCEVGFTEAGQSSEVNNASAERF